MERTVPLEDLRLLRADLEAQLTTSFVYFGKTYNYFQAMLTFVTFECFCRVADNVRFLYDNIKLSNGTKLKLPAWYAAKYSHLFETQTENEQDRLFQYEQERLKGVANEDRARLMATFQVQLTTPFTYFEKTCNSLDDLFEYASFEAFCSRADNVRFLYNNVLLSDGDKPTLPSWYVEKYSRFFERST